MRLFKALCALALSLVAVAATAQEFPTRPITVIVPFPPGGSSDTTMRAMSGKLAELLGQPVVLDNKPGANGSIGATAVARAKPDGYTLLIGSVGTYAINPVLYPSLSYDPRRDFDLLMIAVRTTNVMVVPASSPLNTVQDLIAHMKKNPGKVSFASSGVGSTDHLSSVLFWQKTGTSGLHAPYKGGGAAINDLIAGHVDVLITNLGVLTGHIKAGKMKALAVTSGKRMADLPNTPTLIESGIKDLEIYSWQGIAAPKGLPRPVTEKLHTALVGSLGDATVKKHLESIGFEVVGGTPSEFTRQLTSEMAQWKSVIDTAGIKPE
jgi:tripartite-type tricarboxylate transporter receptor subunit TctC